MARDETGAVLVLALVFILAVGLLMGALVDLVGTNMLATSNLNRERTVEYASDAALEMAVQAVRYAPATPDPCAAGEVVRVTSADVPSLGGQEIGVWCVQSPVGGQRQVTFCAGASSMGGCSTPAPTGELARAQVLFQDVAPSCVSSCVATPGLAMSIESWSIDVASH